jgi:hypothetical protein
MTSGSAWAHQMERNNGLKYSITLWLRGDGAETSAVQSLHALQLVRTVSTTESRTGVPAALFSIGEFERNASFAECADVIDKFIVTNKKTLKSIPSAEYVFDIGIFQEQCTIMETYRMPKEVIVHLAEIAASIQITRYLASEDHRLLPPLDTWNN